MSVTNKNLLQNRSFQFSLEIIKFTSGLPNKQIYWVFRDQLLRSGTSIGSNIYEAIAAVSTRDFVNYYSISLKSANETIYWLRLLNESKLVKDTLKIDILVDEAEQLSKMLGASIIKLKRKK